MLCIGVTVLLRVAFLVAAQSRSIFRFLFFGNPLFLLPYLPGGLAAGVAFLVFARRREKAYLLATSAIMLLSFALWWGVARPPLSTWLLPPETK